MPTLSWNEIRQRAIQFSREWSEESREHAEAQTFWNEFFHVFGMRRRQVASFEEKVRSIKGQHRIDLFWKGKLLAEHKSRGEDLGKATSQAFNYIQELINDGRQDECPRYVAISDFQTIVLYDLEPDDQLELPRQNMSGQMDVIEFPVRDLHQHIKHFAFMAGMKTQKLREQDPANMVAVKIMARLHDELIHYHYKQPDLERLLVRLLFCLFADDTGVFEPDSFHLYIENNTREDGYDLGPALLQLFEILNTPDDQRQHIVDEELRAFPYVNGELFSEHLHFPRFDRGMRTALLAACRFEWSKISPAIFGSLFQGVMEKAERRKLGAHYTSERDILKLIKPLFLDELHAEFQHLAGLTAQRRKSRLEAFQQKLGSLKFLDPACGCGNFLVIAYRELRKLELDVIKLLHDADEVQQFTAIELQMLSKVDVDQFYGIEIDMWPSRIAETALWLTDHQMNRELSEAFGQIFLRIPLKKSPHIICANALRTPWEQILPPQQCNYILGNPPFVGKHYQTKEQKADLKAVMGDIKGHGLLDFVTAWYLLAANYMQAAEGAQSSSEWVGVPPSGGHASQEPAQLSPKAPDNQQAWPAKAGTPTQHTAEQPQNTPAIRAALVSTNSITMGEQVGVLWPALFAKGVQIHFAHRTFSWQSEASGAAHVHVVIIGFGLHDVEKRIIFEYENIKADGKAIEVAQINPYLIEAAPFVLPKRSKPMHPVAEMTYGSKPVDSGFLLLETEQKNLLLAQEPEAERFIRPFLGSVEFINGRERWCLWLHDESPSEYRHLSAIRKLIEQVREFRLASVKAKTREDALRAYEFAEIRQPENDYILVPEVSSERRQYIPVGYVKAEVIVSNLAYAIPNATPYHFGVLTSAMHMAWVRQVCGRLESRYRYSAKLVYNNYPWPVEASKEQQRRIEEAAEGVLAAREKYLSAGSTLADLYDPLTMPADLLKAHQTLDRAVDLAYRRAAFHTERERVEFLFALYEQLTAPLAATPKKQPRRRQKPPAE